jgi:hypothetical protein
VAIKENRDVVGQTVKHGIADGLFGVAGIFADVGGAGVELFAVADVRPFALNSLVSTPA